MAILLLNDHWWKATYGGPVTGILSDFAGLAFFPLTLQAAWEVGLAALRRPWGPSRRALIVAICGTAVVFASVQLLPVGGEAYRQGLGWLQAPFRGGYAPVDLTRDPYDLLALPALGLAARVGLRRCG